MPISFNGDHLVKSSGSPGANATPVTVSFWAGSNSIQLSKYLFEIGSAGASVSLQLNGSGYLDAVLENSKGVYHCVATAQNIGTGWHHICAVYTDAYRQLWYDGVKLAEVVDAADHETITGYMAIGMDTGESVSGMNPLYMANFAVWTATLSSTEIVSLFNGAPAYSIQPRYLDMFFEMSTPQSNYFVDSMKGILLVDDLGAWTAFDVLPPVARPEPQTFALGTVLRPWERLAPWYNVKFFMTGVDITSLIDFPTVSIKDTGGVEIETASFSMRPTVIAPPYEWRDVKIFLNYGEMTEVCLFAGHVTRPTTTFKAGEVRRNMKCEGYKTLLSRSKPFASYWKNETLTTIVEDLLIGGERIGFTVRATDATVGYWTVTADESITKNLDRLCSEFGWRWRVTWELEIIIGPEGEDIAPFGICQGSDADYFLMFPVEEVEYEQDGSQIANAIFLTGGTAVSDDITDTFVGDSSTTIFTLATHPITSIISIKVNGVAQSWGTIGYHNCSERDVLVHFAQGYVSFCTAPGTGLSVEVIYNYSFAYTYEGTSSPSESEYGVWLWELVDAPWISDDTEAATYVASIFAERAFSPKRLSTETRRSGLRAGQTLPVLFTDFGLGGGEYVHIDSIGITFDNKRRPRFALRLGPNNEKLSSTIQGIK